MKGASMTSHVQMRSIPPRIKYVANGTTTEYEFPFVIFKTSDIDVYFNDKLQDKSYYTVSTDSETKGGIIIFKTAPKNGIIITIVRNLSIERTTDFQEGGALRAKVLNNELDYQIACQQQIADNLNRSMVLPPYATDTDVNLTLPTPCAGKAIVWNSDGTNLENSTVEVNTLENTIRGYKESAESAANIATAKATIASNKAELATEKAQIATDKATEAVSILADKANKDMDNLSSTGKGNLYRYGRPDYNSCISLGTLSLPYTCPYDGYYFLYLDKTSVSLGGLYVNNVGVGFTNYTNQYDSVSVIAECSAGDIITAQNQRTDGVTRCQYIPYKGV